jgi:hypothetical protein
VRGGNHALSFEDGRPWGEDHVSALRSRCHAGWVTGSVHPSGPFDPGPALNEAARRISADVSTTTTLRTALTIRFDDQREMFLYTFGGHTYGPLVATSEAEAVVFLAELVQDDVIERLWQPWPACPGHGHPAQPVLRSERPVWVCPATGTPLSEIGHLLSP